MGLIPSIPHNVGIRSLKIAVDKREQKNRPTEGLVQMGECVLKNNFFEFSNQIKQQISGAGIGAKCAPTYACIFRDKIKTYYLEKLFCWVRYIDGIFFIWTHVQEKLKVFLEGLNNFYPNLKFTSDSIEEILHL